MRTLFIVCKSVYPPAGGASLRNWQNINAASLLGRVGVFGVVPDGGAPPRPEVLNWMEIHDTPPFQRPTRNVLWRKIETLQRHVHPYHCNRADRHYSSTLADRLHAALDDFRPDVVVIEELWLYPYLSVLRDAGCVVVFDAHNVEAPLRLEMRTAGSDLLGWRSRLDLWSIRNIERSLVTEADQVWTCSTRDAEAMKALYDPSPIRVIPNTLDASTYAPVREQQRDDVIRPVLTFIGSFGYGPNRRAAHLLLDEIFPLVREKHPESRLHLVGSHPSAHMQEEAEDDPSIIVTGFVDDIRSYLAGTDVAVIPLSEGSGTRLKVIEAFACELPVISTRKGVEGLEVEDEIHVLLADTPEEMANQVSRLVRDSELRRHIACNGHDLMQRLYSWQSIRDEVANALSHLHGEKLCLMQQAED